MKTKTRSVAIVLPRCPDFLRLWPCPSCSEAFTEPESESELESEYCMCNCINAIACNCCWSVWCGESSTSKIRDPEKYKKKNTSQNIFVYCLYAGRNARRTFFCAMIPYGGTCRLVPLRKKKISWCLKHILQQDHPHYGDNFLGVETVLIG